MVSLACSCIFALNENHLVINRQWNESDIKWFRFFHLRDLGYNRLVDADNNHINVKKRKIH